MPTAPRAFYFTFLVQILHHRAHTHHTCRPTHTHTPPPTAFSGDYRYTTPSPFTARHHGEPAIHTHFYCVLRTRTHATRFVAFYAHTFAHLAPDVIVRISVVTRHYAVVWLTIWVHVAGRCICTRCATITLLPTHHDPVDGVMTHNSDDHHPTPLVCRFGWFPAFYYTPTPASRSDPSPLPVVPPPTTVLCS